MSAGFRLVVGSDPDHEDLVGELYFDEAIVCVVTQERGFENLQIELYSPPSEDHWSFRLTDFEEALTGLKKRLFELRRPPRPSR